MDCQELTRIDRLIRRAELVWHASIGVLAFAGLVLAYALVH